MKQAIRTFRVSVLFTKGEVEVEDKRIAVDPSASLIDNALNSIEKQGFEVFGVIIRAKDHMGTDFNVFTRPVRRQLTDGEAVEASNRVLAIISNIDTATGRDLKQLLSEMYDVLGVYFNSDQVDA